MGVCKRAPWEYGRVLLDGRERRRGRRSLHVGDGGGNLMGRGRGGSRRGEGGRG